MAGLASLLPRFVALPLVALLGTATLTFAANSQLTRPSTPAQPAAVSLPTVLVVPDVRRQAFVFAKGTLEDAGFFCVDNLPPELLRDFLRLERKQRDRRIAIAVDVRSADSLPSMSRAMLLR